MQVFYLALKMTTILDNIPDGENLEYKGNIQISGNIGKNVNLTLYEGNLIVKGDIGDREA